MTAQTTHGRTETSVADPLLKPSTSQPFGLMDWSTSPGIAVSTISPCLMVAGTEVTICMFFTTSAA